MFTRFMFTLMMILSTSTAMAVEPQIEIDITVPSLNVNPYHRPYIAVWLETPKRQYVTTLALWADDMEWYKDLRQWWRKAGRANENFDGVTSATKKPGTYTIKWSGKDANNQPVPAGTYQLNVEASREEGDREFIKTKITIDQQGQVNLTGKRELGHISLSIQTQE